MHTIYSLDQDVINQISAGEVAEDSMSVIKELVENSIDAKGTAISIEIAGMGLSKIIVQDNGVGLSKEDLFVCH